MIVEDVTTTGGSAMKAVESVRETGAEVVLVLTMVDREEGATDTFGAAGLPFRSLYQGVANSLKARGGNRPRHACGRPASPSLAHPERSLRRDKPGQTALPLNRSLSSRLYGESCAEIPEGARPVP